MKTIIKRYLLLMALILLSGCNPAVNIQFATSSFINPDFKNRALPVLIRIYQLSETDSFSEATFHQLWLFDGQILGASLIKRQEFELNPNSLTTIKIMPDKSAHYIGIIALYRNPKHCQWRLIKNMPNSAAAVLGHISIKISGNTIYWVNEIQDKSL